MSGSETADSLCPYTFDQGPQLTSTGYLVCRANYLWTKCIFPRTREHRQGRPWLRWARLRIDRVELWEANKIDMKAIQNTVVIAMSLPSSYEPIRVDNAQGSMSKEAVGSLRNLPYSPIVAILIDVLYCTSRETFGRSRSLTIRERSKLLFKVESGNAGHRQTKWDRDAFPWHGGAYSGRALTTALTTIFYAVKCPRILDIPLSLPLCFS